MSEMEKNREVSRRTFLRGAGASLAGIALAGGIGAVLGAKTEAHDVTEPPVHPFEYKELDPDEAARRGYEGYKKDG